jgi:hypothetical protein
VRWSAARQGRRSYYRAESSKGYYRIEHRPSGWVVDMTIHNGRDHVIGTFSSLAGAKTAASQHDRGFMSRRRRSRRRHHAAEANPISSSTKKWLVIGGLTAVAGVGLYLYMKKMSALTQMPMPAALPPGTAPINLTLSPGNLSAVTLSAGNKAALSLFAPQGSTLQVMNWNPVAPLAPATTSNYEVVAATPGNSTVTATYKDASGATQTATIPIVVTA